jgi:hypothetical protein
MESMLDLERFGLVGRYVNSRVPLVVVLACALAASWYFGVDLVRLSMALQSWICSWIPGNTSLLCSGIPGPCY